MAKKFKCNVCGQTFEAESMPDKCPICTAPASEIVEEAAPAAAGEAKPKKKGLDTNSNVYTIIYAAVMVVIVAFLLAFVSDALKPTQDANVLRDTKNQILTSLNIEGLTGEAVDAKYAEVITDTMECNEKEFYVANVDGAVKYVLPVKGRGLWGGLWGYIAVDENKTTVFGTYFSHESETAGLGARINERWFQQQFNGKPIFDEAGNVALTVVKQGAATQPTEVDGVTGATLTSKGVGAMVTEGLAAYQEFLGVAEQAEEMDCCKAKKAHCGEGGCGMHEGCPGEGGCGMHEGCPKAEGGCGMHEGCPKAEGECGMHEGCPKGEGHCQKAEGECCKNKSNN